MQTSLVEWDETHLLISMAWILATHLNREQFEDRRLGVKQKQWLSTHIWLINISQIHKVYGWDNVEACRKRMEWKKQCLTHHRKLQMWFTLQIYNCGYDIAWISSLDMSGITRKLRWGVVWACQSFQVVSKCLYYCQKEIVLLTSRILLSTQAYMSMADMRFCSKLYRLLYLWHWTTKQS